MVAALVRVFISCSTVLVISHLAFAQQSESCSDRKLNTISKSVAKTETACRRVLSNVEKARAERAISVQYANSLPELANDKERGAFCAKEPRDRKGLCRKISSAISRNRVGALLTGADKSIISRARSADQTCERLNQASAQLTRSRQSCNVSQKENDNDSTEFATFSGPLAAYNREDGDEPKCDINNDLKDDDAPTDGRCTRLGGVIVTADRSPPVYIPIIGNRGPTGPRGSDPSNPSGTGGGAAPSNPPGFIGCDPMDGESVCLKKIEPLCQANLAEGIKRIKARCFITGGYLESLLREKKFNFYFQDPRTVSTTEDGVVDRNSVVEELSAYAGTFKGLMDGLIRDGFGAINLNAKHIEPDCKSVNPSVVPGPYSASNIDVLLIHEALHLILDIHHGENLLGLDDPMYKFAERDDCGEGEWPKYLK